MKVIILHDGLSENNEVAVNACQDVGVEFIKIRKKDFDGLQPSGIIIIDVTTNTLYPEKKFPSTWSPGVYITSQAIPCSGPFGVPSSRGGYVVYRTRREGERDWGKTYTLFSWKDVRRVLVEILNESK